MADGNKKVKIKGKENKVVEIKQNSNIAFQLLVQAQSQNLSINLEEVMKYPLTPVPSCFGSPDGFLSNFSSLC